MVSAIPLLTERRDPDTIPLVERFVLVETFFGDHPGPGPAGPGLGRAVIDFVRWEAASGRIADDGGSPWWRAVNGGLVLDLAEAAIAHRLSVPVEREAVAGWLEYANAPPGVAQARLWRAHRLSLQEATTRSAPLLEHEPAAEQQFARLVLAVVEDAASRGTPTDTGVLASLTAQWYPDHYPITQPALDALSQGQEGSR